MLRWSKGYYRRRNNGGLEGPFDTIEMALDRWAFSSALNPCVELSCEEEAVEGLSERMLRQVKIPAGSEVEINGETWLVTGTAKSRKISKVR